MLFTSLFLPSANTFCRGLPHARTRIHHNFHLTLLSRAYRCTLTCTMNEYRPTAAQRPIHTSTHRTYMKNNNSNRMPTDRNVDGLGSLTNCHRFHCNYSKHSYFVFILNFYFVFYSLLFFATFVYLFFLVSYVCDNREKKHEKKYIRNSNEIDWKMSIGAHLSFRVDDQSVAATRNKKIDDILLNSVLSRISLIELMRKMEENRLSCRSSFLSLSAPSIWIWALPKPHSIEELFSIMSKMLAFAPKKEKWKELLNCQVSIQSHEPSPNILVTLRH